MERQIEPESGTKRFRIRGSRMLTEHDLNGITRHQMQQREHEAQHAEHYQRRS